MEKIREIQYLSDLDNSMQPALVRGAEGDEARPLVVCLHTWSADIDKPVYYEKYVEKDSMTIDFDRWIDDENGSEFLKSVSKIQPRIERRLN